MLCPCCAHAVPMLCSSCAHAVPMLRSWCAHAVLTPRSCCIASTTGNRPACRRQAAPKMPPAAMSYNQRLRESATQGHCVRAHFTSTSRAMHAHHRYLASVTAAQPSPPQPSQSHTADTPRRPPSRTAELCFCRTQAMGMRLTHMVGRLS